MALRIHLHGADLVGTGAPQVTAIHQGRIDHQRPLAIIAIHAKPHDVSRHPHIAALNFAAGRGQRVFLVNQRLLLQHAPVAEFERQIALGCDAEMPGPLESQANRMRIGARLQHEVELQLVLPSVVDHIHPRIDRAISDPRVVRDVGVPVLPGPYEIVGARGKLAHGFDGGGRIGIRQRDIHPMGAGEGQGGPVRGEHQIVAARPHGVKHCRVPLALVGLETQGRLGQPRLGLRYGCFARRRGQCQSGTQNYGQAKTSKHC